MRATALSRVRRRIWMMTNTERIEKEAEGPWFPSRTRRRWPAIIFAVRRTARVPGRMIFLIVSIRTIKGIKIAGVPLGTIWASMCVVWLNHP